MGLSVNFLAVVVAAIAAFIVGFLWHGPLFGKTWIKLSGITQSDMEKAKQQNMTPTMVAAFVQMLVMGYVLAQFVGVWGATEWKEGFVLAFWIWLGFIATVMLNGVLWEKRTVNLYLFNTIYQLVSIIVMTEILVLMK